MAPAYDSDRNTLQVQDLKRTDTKINEPTVVVEFVNSEEGFSGLSSRWSAIRCVFRHIASSVVSHPQSTGRSSASPLRNSSVSCCS